MSRREEEIELSLLNPIKLNKYSLMQTSNIYLDAAGKVHKSDPEVSTKESSSRDQDRNTVVIPPGDIDLL